MMPIEKTAFLLEPPPTPLVTLESTAYWEAAKVGKLLIKRCSDCGKVHFYPRDICPHCLGPRTIWTEASGKATLYSFSRTFTQNGEYTLAYVRLQEGVTLMSNLIDYEPNALRIDMRLLVVFVPTGDGKHAIPMFRPSAA